MKTTDDDIAVVTFCTDVSAESFFDMRILNDADMRSVRLYSRENFSHYVDRRDLELDPRTSHLSRILMLSFVARRLRR